MKKVSLAIMVISAILIVVFTVTFWHPITDNAVDSDGYWCYMYGVKSNLWPTFSLAVIFLMALTCYFATFSQKTARFK